MSGYRVWAKIYNGNTFVRSTEEFGTPIVGTNHIETISGDVYFSEAAGTYDVFVVDGPSGTAGNHESQHQTLQITGSSTSRLIVYSGYGQFINPDEKLSYFGDYANHAYHGYFVSIQARNASGQILGSGNVSFSYTPNDGYLVIPTTSIGNLVTNLAIPDVIYSGEYPSGPSKEFTVRAAMNISGTNVSVDFPLTIRPDLDPSVIRGPLHHQKPASYPFYRREVGGDGYADRDEGTAPFDPNRKNVVVEVDWSSSFADRSLIPEIMTEVNRIWEDSCGVTIIFASESQISTSIDDVPEYMTLPQTRTILSANRFLPNAIHVLIGRSASDWLGGDVRGITIDYRIVGGRSRMECASLATGDPTQFQTATNLSECGILIFGDRLAADIQAHGNEIPLLGGWAGRRARFYAWFIAHEIAHALGRVGHDSNSDNLMKQGLNNLWDSTTPSYYDYMRLYQETSLDLINTRNVVGINTVDTDF